MKPKIVILGAGFIGSNLIRSYLRNGYNIRVLDYKPCPLEFADKVEWVQGSFLNIEDIRKAITGSNIVFHFISTTVPGDKVDEGEELSVDVIQTINLLKLCLEQQIERIVFISSSSVYGQQDSMPIRETAATDPISSHGIQKLTIEKYFQLYKYEYGLDCKIMRLSNPYGIGQDLYGRQGFIAIVLGRILEDKAIQIRGDGNIVRDYIYIEDVVNACQLLANTSSENTIFNIGSGQGYSLLQIVSQIELILGREIELKYVKARNTDIPVSVLDTSLARAQLQFEPKIRLTEGIELTMRYYGLL